MRHESWHSVTQTSEQDGERNSLMLTYYVQDSAVDWVVERLKGLWLSWSMRRGADAGYSPSVMMICVSPEPLRILSNRTTEAMIVGGFSPGIAPSAVITPSKPEFTDWKR